MTERPILFSAPMVRAILSGQKTQTRRIVSSANSLVNGSSPCMKANGLDAWPNLDFTTAWVDKGPSPAGNAGPYLKVPGGDESVHRIYPRVWVGDRLWIRETYALIWPGESPPKHEHENIVEYRADHPDKRPPGQWPEELHSDIDCPRWRPSIHMPKWASRLTLEVTSVRVERVNSISERDAKAEGVEPDVINAWFDSIGGSSDPYQATSNSMHRAGFKTLWSSINGKHEGCSWDANPWVWVFEFRRVDAAAKTKMALEGASSCR